MTDPVEAAAEALRVRFGWPAPSPFWRGVAETALGACDESALIANLAQERGARERAEAEVARLRTWQEAYAKGRAGLVEQADQDFARAEAAEAALAQAQVRIAGYDAGHDRGKRIGYREGWKDALAPQRITHGRHCICSACAAQDWTDPRLAACGMHGPSCPREYQPLGAAGDAPMTMVNEVPPEALREVLCDTCGGRAWVSKSKLSDPPPIRVEPCPDCNADGAIPLLAFPDRTER